VRNWPATEPAVFAEQRLAHLPGAEMLAAKRETPKVAMRQFDQNIGLQQSPGSPDAPFESATEQANRLVKRLKQFPEDWETREQLASLYANHLHRLDLATLELNSLID